MKLTCYDITKQREMMRPIVIMEKQSIYIEAQLYRNLTAYYPYGLPLAEWQGEDRYLYSGKELERTDGLMLYDHHARLYDPQLGRFISPDPLAADYAPTAPHLYCAANPIAFTDPTGMRVRLLGNSAVRNQYLSNLNKGYNLSLSLDKSLQLQYTLPPFYIPKPIEYELINAIESNHVNVNMRLFNQDVIDGQAIICGAFMGNRRNSDGTITAEQYANPRQMEKYSNFYPNTVGSSEAHEIVEAYLGAVFFPDTGAAHSSNQNYDKYLIVHNYTSKLELRYTPIYVGIHSGEEHFMYFKFPPAVDKILKPIWSIFHGQNSQNTNHTYEDDKTKIEEQVGRFTE